MMTLVYLFTVNYAGMSNPFMALARGMSRFAQNQSMRIGSDILWLVFFHLGGRDNIGHFNGYRAPTRILTGEECGEESQ